MQKPSKLISLLSQVEICNVNIYEMCIFAWGQSHNIVDIGAWWWVLSLVRRQIHSITKQSRLLCNSVEYFWKYIAYFILKNPKNQSFFMKLAARGRKLTKQSHLLCNSEEFFLKHIAYFILKKPQNLGFLWNWHVIEHFRHISLNFCKFLQIM